MSSAGNSIIFKPSEVTPQIGAFIHEVLSQFLPANIFQIAQGDGGVGELISKHPDISLIAFTGSTAAGKSILKNASEGYCRCVLECWGKDAMVVFADADLEKASDEALKGAFFNTGQCCASIERIYVASSVKTQFEVLCAQKCLKYVAGPSKDPRSMVSCLASKHQLSVVKSHVNDAVAKGAKILAKGGSVNGNDHKGYYFEATVVSDVPESSLLFTEETFGPVCSIGSFDGTEEEAVSCANRGNFGLGATVFTSNVDAGTRVAKGIKAGQVGVNCWGLLKACPAATFHGCRCSGYSGHSGIEGFQSFSTVKSVIYPDACVCPTFP